jgi:hypothetical protein
VKMTRGVGRAGSTGLLAALAAIVWLALFYGLNADLVVDFDTAPPSLLTGVYPNERDPVSGTRFAWTGEEVTLRLPELDRRVGWTLKLRVRGARAQAAQNPELTLVADGLQIERRQTATDYEDLAVLIPARANSRGLTISIRASSTFVPGASDPRALGVMLDELRLSPAGIVVPPRSAFAGAASAAAAMGAAIAALGLTAGSAIGAAVVIAAGVASPIARGFAPYTNFPDIASRTGIAIALSLVVGTAIVRLRMGAPLRNTARFAAAFSASALLLKLLVLLHPDMPVGDALFHAHRFQEVLAGHLFFTFVAPGNRLFPGAPGLYVFSSALAGLVSRGSADIALLRIVCTIADAVAATLLYGMVVRVRGDRLAGACAVAIHHLIPLDFGVLALGNLTNAFGQALSVAALVMVASAPLQAARSAPTLLLTGVLTAAFLSHTSTFAVLSVACLTTVVLYWRYGGQALRPSTRALTLSVVIAIVLAVVSYYAYYLETYRTQLSRIATETATGAPDAAGRGILERLLGVPRDLYVHVGIPTLILTAWGARSLWRAWRSDRLTLSILGWTLACAVFLVIGIATPVQMRYYLASIPVFAVVAGLGASAGWSVGGSQRAVAAALLAWGLVEGVRGWWLAIG